MAFIVLDPDAPQSDANSYASEAEFTEWHTDRGVAQVVDQAYEPTQIQSALIQATDFIDKRYGQKFRGFKRSRSQRLEWPRIDAYDNDNYSLDRRPDQLLGATVEYALLALQLGRNLAPAVTPGFSYLGADGAPVDAGAGQVTKTRDKAGPLESEIAYSDTGSLTAFLAKIPEYPQADMWLKELTRSNRRVVRG